MKQAILILAYSNFKHLIEIIKYFDDDFFIYIHIDKKNTINKKLLEKIRLVNNVKFVSTKYSINWGGINIVKASLLLAREALNNNENKYFHLISGQDFPSQGLTHFKNLLKEKNNRDYMNNFFIPSNVWKTENGGLDRIKFYHFFDYIDTKKHNIWLWRLFKIQKILNIKRSFPKEIKKFYGGSTWWSLSRETLHYVVNYSIINKGFFNRMHYTRIPDEYYFQSVIMNSKYAVNVVNENLRYIIWDTKNAPKNSGSPAILDTSHLPRIISSSYLFARKFVTPKSDELRTLLKRKLKTKKYN